MNHLRFSAIVAVLCLLAGGAAAQKAEDQLTITTTPKGTRVAVQSAGQSITIGGRVGPDTSGKLIDLDNDGLNDVVLSKNWEDGWAMSVWLRRGKTFVEALATDFIEWDRIVDLDGDGRLEGIYPEPTPIGVFSAFSIKTEGLFDGDAIRAYRLKGDAYVLGKVDCSSPLRDDYLAAIGEVDRTLTRNETSSGSSYEDNYFSASILAEMRGEILLWRERFSEGCTS